MEKVAVVLLVLAVPALLAGCLADPAPPVATGQIDGAVVDQLLRPFSNQTVYLSPLGWRDSTSRLGGFTFREVPVGSYTVLASHDGTLGAGASVQVEEGRITKVILQLMPVHKRDPWMDIFPSESRYENLAFTGGDCGNCSWDFTLDDHPAEAVFTAKWSTSQFGHDAMRIRITDDLGHTVYDQVAPGSPFTASVDGVDLHADARGLHVEAGFGQDFTPRPQFKMDATMTLYYGATREQLFG